MWVATGFTSTGHSVLHGLSMGSAGGLPVTGRLACPGEPPQQQSRPVLERQSAGAAAAEGEAAHCSSACSVRQAPSRPPIPSWRPQRSQPCSQPWAQPARHRPARHDSCCLAAHRGGPPAWQVPDGARGSRHRQARDLLQAQSCWTAGRWPCHKDGPGRIPDSG